MLRLVLAIVVLKPPGALAALTEMAWLEMPSVLLNFWLTTSIDFRFFFYLLESVSFLVSRNPCICYCKLSNFCFACLRRFITCSLSTYMILFSNSSCSSLLKPCSSCDFLLISDDWSSIFSSCIVFHSVLNVSCSSSFRFCAACSFSDWRFIRKSIAWMSASRAVIWESNECIKSVWRRKLARLWAYAVLKFCKLLCKCASSVACRLVSCPNCSESLWALGCQIFSLYSWIVCV